MEKNYSNWKKLPAELLYKIFGIAATYQRKADLRNYVLVCKAWKSTSQAALYSSVNIKSILQLQKFFETVMLNPLLGNMVKRFSLYIFVDADNEINRAVVIDIMSNLLTTSLSGLEVLNAYSLTTYVPRLDALLDSHLKHLKRIDPPTSIQEKSEIANYITCALLMKDRIQSISISDNYVRGRINEKLYFNRLYDRLHQFDKLTDISISRKTSNEIEVLEQIVEG